MITMTPISNNFSLRIESPKLNPDLLCKHTYLIASCRFFISISTVTFGLSPIACSPLSLRLSHFYLKMEKINIQNSTIFCSYFLAET